MPSYVFPALFFFSDPATTEIYTLSLHDALPILTPDLRIKKSLLKCNWTIRKRLSSCILVRDRKSGSAGMPRPISYAVFCLKKKSLKKATGKHHRRKEGSRGPRSAGVDQTSAG